MKLKYLLSDLDGVIRLFPGARASAIELQHGLPPGSLMATAFEKPLLQRAVCGLISDEEWRAEIARNLARDLEPKTVKAAVQEWSDFPGIVDFRVFECYERRFPGVPLAVLTNGTTRLRRDLEILGIDDRFAKVFNSAELGVCKPDLKIYQKTLAALGCAAWEILFIDDSPAHVQTARDLGMQAYHYTGFDEFEDYVSGSES